jgi:GT2 family glycosyltransferase
VNKSANQAGDPLVSIVVLNLNGRRHLPPLLAHLAVQTVRDRGRDFELIFVDNGSTDDSAALVEQGCAAYGIPLRLLRNDRNHGFAPACNQGLALARAPWVAMLNNDTRPAPDWLHHLLDAAHSETGDDARATAHVGMVASKMLRAHKPDEIDSAGIAVDWAGIAWDWRGGEPDTPDERGLAEIFGPCGGAALYSRAMLVALGGFDADFFAYLEDVDLAWRARLGGWRCLFQPQARVLHAHSSTLGDTSPLKRFLLGRNKVWLLAKNLPDPDLIAHWPAVVGYDALAVGYGVLQRGDFAALRGRLAGLAGLAQVWPKRRRVQAQIVDADNWRRFMAPRVPPWQVPHRYRHLT